MLILDHPRVPPTGHYIIDASNITFRAKDIPALERVIALYRSNNALPAGNPLAEIEAFYAVHFPWLISNVGAAPEPPKEEFLREWINRLWKNPPKHWQESEKAKERLQICGLCPFNMPGGIISDVYRRRLIILGAGKITEGAGWCSAHRWANGLAAWIESPETPAGDVPGCWATSPKP
jgi:hypothetical protein